MVPFYLDVFAGFIYKVNLQHVVCMWYVQSFIISYSCYLTFTYCFVISVMSTSKEASRDDKEKSHVDKGSPILEMEAMSDIVKKTTRVWRSKEFDKSLAMAKPPNVVDFLAR